MSLHINSRFCSIALAGLATIGLGGFAHAATVGAGGYTNAFAAAPPVGDWSTLSVAGTSAEVASPAALDTQVQLLTAASVATAIGADMGDPPVETALGRWSSTGQYLQTRPTGVRYNVLMCTLINGTGIAAGGARLVCSFNKAAQTQEEVPGYRAYFSRSGTANSWTLIPEFSAVQPGQQPTANITACWPAGQPLYVLFADDNDGAGPDGANQLDNFSAATLPVVPLTVTSHPQSQTNTVGSPTVFCVSASGTPPTYQWQRNNGAGGSWANISGATFACYTNATTPLGAAGQYRALLSNCSGGSITSQVATLTVFSDTTGPVMLSAEISALTNQILIKFNETLNQATVNNQPGLSNFAVFSRTATATNRIGVSNVFHNSGSNNQPYAVVQVGGPNWIVGGGIDGTISYYVLVNNVRDDDGNVIAPNSVMGITFFNEFVTNVITYGSVWRYHPDWVFDPTIYQQPWSSASYDASQNPSWAYIQGLVVSDLAPPATYCVTNATRSGDSASYQDTPTLFRYEFFWPTNYSTNVTLRLGTIYDDGVVAYLNGTEIRRDNVQGTAPIDDTTKSAAGGGPRCTSNNIGGLTLLSGRTNVLAAAVVQAPGGLGEPNDITFGAHMDVVARTAVEGRAPTNGIPASQLRIATSGLKVGTNQIRISWPTNTYNYTVEFTTNLARVGNSNVLGPWFQMQPGVSNGMTTNFPQIGLPYFIRLHKVP